MWLGALSRLGGVPGTMVVADARALPPRSLARVVREQGLQWAKLQSEHDELQRENLGMASFGHLVFDFNWRTSRATIPVNRCAKQDMRSILRFCILSTFLVSLCLL